MSNAGRLRARKRDPYTSLGHVAPGTRAARSIAFPHVVRRFDPRLRVKARTDKRGRDLDGFETVFAAGKELRHRLRVLHADRRKASAKLAAMLQNCRYGRLCGSLACPRCARVRRIEHSATVLEFLTAYEAGELRFVTLINLADAVPAGKLHDFDPRKLVARTRRQLERAGIDKAECFLIGAVDGEWDEGWALFQPHLHFVTWGVTNADLQRVIKPWPRDPKRVRVRKRLEEIDDLPRVVAYLEKSFWPRVARKKNPREIHPHGKQRLPAHIELEVLHWFHRHHACNLRFVYGAKTYRRRLVKH